MSFVGLSFVMAPWDNARRPRVTLEELTTCSISLPWYLPTSRVGPLRGSRLSWAYHLLRPALLLRRYGRFLRHGRLD